MHNQILMLSGIGPNSELRKHGINQILDLPVGQNLQDHCLVLQTARIGKPDGEMSINAMSYLNPLSFVEYYANGTGPLTNNGMGAVGVMHTSPKGKDRRPGCLN